MCGLRRSDPRPVHSQVAPHHHHRRRCCCKHHHHRRPRCTGSPTTISAFSLTLLKKPAPPLRFEYLVDSFANLMPLLSKLSLAALIIIINLQSLTRSLMARSLSQGLKKCFNQKLTMTINN